MTRLRRDERILFVGEGKLMIVGLRMTGKRYRKLINSHPDLMDRFAWWKRVAILEDEKLNQADLDRQSRRNQ